MKTSEGLGSILALASHRRRRTFMMTALAYLSLARNTIFRRMAYESNIAGAEAGPNGVAQGFNKIRTYSPGPCTGACTHDWDEQSKTLQHTRWYPSAQTLVDGSVLVVGGADAGGLVLNEANINVPTYEIIYQDGRAPPAPVPLPILDFTSDQNLVPGKSYNLYQ